jgi:hypothetical protein
VRLFARCPSGIEQQARVEHDLDSFVLEIVNRSRDIVVGHTVYGERLPNVLDSQ